MEPSIFSVLSRKIVTAVISIGSLFYSTIPGTNASFTDLLLSIKGQQLVLSTHLENCFSDELDQVFRSGKEIKIYFRVELVQAGNNKSVKDTTFYHSISYSVLDDVFDVYLTETETRYPNLNLEQAKEFLVEIEGYRAITVDQLKKDRTYYLRLEAKMDKIKLQGMEEPLNLMFYWNSLKPVVQSTPFTQELFTQ
ncbi:MAG: DUF4390 domain-containing protein [Fidelibacterota bacterium]